MPLELNTITEQHVIEFLSELPEEIVDCCITSPPYYGLRDYGTEDVFWPEVTYSPMVGMPEITIPAGFYSLGLEPTIEAFIGHIVLVFRGVHRVLKDDGTLWINFGDSYTGYKAGTGDTPYAEIVNRPEHKTGWVFGGLKPKDLIGVPWRVAFALQADGWFLRSDVIWSKPNPMPESVTDRPTKAHEYIFLLSKSERYFFDQEAIKEQAIGNPSGNKIRVSRPTQQAIQRGDQCGHIPYLGGETRNKRSVWEVSTKPFKEAHFAVFPEELIEPMILAATSEKGHCPDCGKRWIRIIEKTGGRNHREDRMIKIGIIGEVDLETGKRGRSSTALNNTQKIITMGFSPQCSCNKSPVPDIVLDTFAGSGTVMKVSRRAGRNSIGSELNGNYVKIGQNRTAQEWLL